MKTIAGKLFTFVLFGLVVSSTLFATDYRYTRIDAPNGTLTVLRAMNAAGDIVGVLDDADGGHGFLFRDGQFTKIDFPGASATRAFGINNTGDITGQYTSQSGVVSPRSMMCPQVSSTLLLSQKFNAWDIQPPSC